MSNEYIILAKRYKKLFKSCDYFGCFYDSRDHLIKMCNKIMRFDDREKQARWIGFIQGVLTAYRIINLEKEIEFCRKLFKGE